MIRGVAGLVEGSEQRAENRGAMTVRLGAELKPHKAGLAQAFTLIIIGSAAQAGAPWLVSRAIDVNIAHKDLPGLGVTLGAMFAVYLGGAIAQRAQAYQIGCIGQTILANLRERLFARFQALPVGFFDRQQLGDLMSRISNDVDTLNQLLSQGLTQVLGSTFSLVGVLVAMLLLNMRLALASFTIIPLMLFVIWYLARHARKAYRATRETTGAVMAGLQEEIGGVREAQAFNRTEENVTRFRARNASNRDANISATAVTSAFTPAIEVLGTLSTALVVGYGATLVFAGQLTVGQLAAFLIYVQQFFRPIQLLTQVSAQFQSALAGAERVYAILDEPAEPAPRSQAVQALSGAGEIEFEDVGFAYVPGRPVMTDVSFVARPGQLIALVGPTGAGKTSIMNLIPRFYDVTAGAVKVDGVDVRDVPVAALRARISIVSQEPFLFGETVLANLSYGRPTATRAEVVAIAQAVGAHDFISALPEGYDTELREGAGQVSLGQRQLLAIARAVLADRPILLLDEATSHVDRRTEGVLQKALVTLMQGRTSLVIAHRLSTVRHADLILVLAEGRIVERGTHDELITLGGLYAQLHQRNAFESAPDAATA